jgi:acetolactate synthase-1/2/3 large subunit
MLYQPDVEVVGDISYSLQQIALRCSRSAEPEKALKLRETMDAEAAASADSDAFPIKPQRILQNVRQVMGPDDILISDVGAHKMWISRHYDCYRPNTCIISNGFATMGLAVPGALAAKLLNPDRKVLAVTGDGGFLMNCQELETARREKTPFVTLIFNDSSYGLIKWKQLDRFGESSYVDFSNPDFVLFAESLGAKGYRIESPDDLIPALEEAFRQDVPAIIDCRSITAKTSCLRKRLKSWPKIPPQKTRNCR